jgi:hypothetical protein
VVDDGPAYHPDEPRERRGERRSKKNAHPLWNLFLQKNRGAWISKFSVE